jgi:hypothetical protein
MASKPLPIQPNNRKQANAVGHYRYLLAVFVCLFGVGPGVFAAADFNNIALQPQALNVVGIYKLRQIEPNLAGAGIRFGIVSRSYTYNGAEPQNDYYVPTRHPCLADRNISFSDDNNVPLGISPHAAAVVSILLGEDANGFNKEIGSFEYEGVAPDANARIYEFRHFIREVVFAAAPIDVDIISISLGSQFEDWWTRGINHLVETDSSVIIAGIGNGTDVYDPTLYPAGGPNVLAVGVVDSVRGPNELTDLANFGLPSAQHSTIGPTNDGRCKPDIVAPANCLAATIDPNRPYEPTGDWSSFSTPIVAGTVGLLVQKAKSDPNLGIAFAPPVNCLFKAIVMNSARKLPFWHKGQITADDDHNCPLDYTQGAGMLDAMAAYNQLVAGPAANDVEKPRGWDNYFVTPTDYRAYYFKADTSVARHIVATLVWNRHYQEQYPFEPLVQKDSNLRLELWAADANNPQNDRLLDYSDSLIDNVEHIYFPVEPNYSEYALVVSFSNATPNDPNAVESYGLAWDVREDLQNDSILWYDLNDDGIVNDDDLNILKSHIALSLPYNPRFDVNMDGVIDLKDLQIINDHTSLTAPWYLKPSVAANQD